ncbi:hypothetical protein AKG98_446 [Moritella sp. JT01]|uniref:DUF3316 domain-containing protein n=1 Tax=Moritella sp. JT01 TaxID=756698 RepID=UPI00079A3436|nr:DUF3316 domain-containing protein [Moritella sp. JT01]KXO14366.1 hypothetical protein AKG98_446 [Moritella sp. JT01]
MKTLILVTALTLSFQSLASPVREISSNTEIYIGITESRAEAYEQGVNTLQQLKLLTGNQAYKKLNLVNVSTVRNSVRVNDGRVYVDEFADADGSLKYQAKVKLSYSYKESGSNR